MSIFNVIMLCFAVFALTVNLTGYALLPDRYPFSFYDTAGWLLFIGAILCWSVVR